MVAEVLQLAQLVELDGVAEMQVGPGGIEAVLDAQRHAARELGHELALDQQLVGAALEDVELLPGVALEVIASLLASPPRVARRAGHSSAGASRRSCGQRSSPKAGAR